MIIIRQWDGFGNQSISGFIALHPSTTCDNFANLLLGDNLFVESIRRENPTNNKQFVQTILSKWHSRSGTPVPCTWEDLILCMKGADLDRRKIQIIEREVFGKCYVGPSEKNYTNYHNS